MHRLVDSQPPGSRRRAPGSCSAAPASAATDRARSTPPAARRWSARRKTASDWLCALVTDQAICALCPIRTAGKPGTLTPLRPGPARSARPGTRPTAASAAGAGRPPAWHDRRPPSARSPPRHCCWRGAQLAGRQRGGLGEDSRRGLRQPGSDRGRASRLIMTGNGAPHGQGRWLARRAVAARPSCRYGPGS